MFLPYQFLTTGSLQPVWVVDTLVGICQLSETPPNWASPLIQGHQAGSQPWWQHTLLQGS